LRTDTCLDVPGGGNYNAFMGNRCLRFEELLKNTGLPVLEIINGGLNPEISSLEFDSRLVGKGSMYFALPGIHTDGHKFTDEAAGKGAAVIVFQNKLRDYNLNYRKDVVYLRVEDSRFAMSPIAAAFYGNPSGKIYCTGVTGTEGKSTTVYLVFQLLRSLGLKAGFISTVEFSVDGSENINPEHQTTPEATVIQRRLFEMLENSCSYAVLECSSHGLSTLTNRLGDVLFDAAVMTNVTREHLEFHKTFEQYRFDKANLFRALAPKNGRIPFGVVNALDRSAGYFKEAAAWPVYSFAARDGAPALLTVRNIRSGAGGNEYDVFDSETGGTYSIKDRLPGAFNAGNVLAALITVSKLLKISVKELVPLVPALRPVKGRMTSVNCGQDFEVLVDYAHTPSSFETIFPPVRKRLPAGAKIIAVFGSAGERDTEKRSRQGNIASLWADIIILTDEDPRGEDPMAILEEIAAGVEGKTRGEDFFLIPDRREAVKKAVSLAAKDDIVLLLGKGHENSIIYSWGGKKTIPYDEINCAREALNELLSATAVPPPGSGTISL